MTDPDVLAWFCEALPALRARAPEAELRALITDAQAGTDIAERADELRRRLRMPPIPSRVRDATPEGGIVGIPGMGGGHPVVETYECPTAECSRMWVRQPGIRFPECALRGGRLKQVGTS